MEHVHPPIPADSGTAASAAGTAAGRYRVWVDDPAGFSTKRRVALRHNFHEHPLMQLPRLAELAKSLTATKQCRYITPGATQTSEFFHEDASRDGRTVDEVFRDIEQPGSWVALYNVETDPVYREFLAEVTGCMRALVDAEQPGMFNIGGFIFISAPPSVTPFHIDRENNFWLQITGKKVMTVFDHLDREVVPQPLVEEFIVFRALEKVRLQPALRPRGRDFHVGPGDGVYFPSTSPHMTECTTEWPRPGDGVSISIGVVFYTDVTRREANVHAFNRVLRKLGLSPREPGHSAWLDAIKVPLGRAVVSVMERRGYKRSVGL